MKTINLKVEITVPDDYILDDIDWLLEDAVNGEFEYLTSLYEDKNECSSNYYNL